MRYIRILLAASLLALAFAAVPRVGEAQSPAGGVCAAGARELSARDSWTHYRAELRSTLVYVFPTGYVPSSYWVWVPQTWQRATFWNYRNVTDLYYVWVANPDGTVSESFSFPDWLQRAYGGDLNAIEQDLRTRHLKDRGACS